MNRSPTKLPRIRSLRVQAAAHQAEPRHVLPPSLYDTRSPSNRDHIHDALGELSFATVPMTPWFTHEINRTVAALAAETRSSPIMAGESCVERNPQFALRSRLPYTRPVRPKSIKRVDDARKRGGVQALGQLTGTKSRRMVWLEVWNGRARVMVDKALYNDWKERLSIKDVKRRQHVLRRLGLSSR